MESTEKEHGLHEKYSDANDEPQVPCSGFDKLVSTRKDSKNVEGQSQGFLRQPLYLFLTFLRIGIFNSLGLVVSSEPLIL
jgi:hypothetical protein